MNDKLIASIVDEDDNKLMRNGSILTVDLPVDYFNYYQQAPACFESSKFMLPIDTDRISKDTVRLSSKLKVNQESLSRLKDQIIADTQGEEEFVNRCSELLLAPTLQMVYAQSQNKTWSAPLHPDNIFIDSDTNIAKCMFRYPQNLQMTDEAIDDLRRIIYWLLFPVSSRDFDVFCSRPFINLNYDNFFDWLSNQTSELLQYTRMETINKVEILLNDLNDAFDENYDIRDMLEVLNQDGLIREVDDLPSALDIDTPPAPVESEEEEEEIDEEDPNDFVEEEPIKEKKPIQKEKPKEKATPAKKKKTGKGKWIFIGGIVLILGIGGVYSLIKGNNNKDTSTQRTTQTSSQQQPTQKVDAGTHCPTFIQGMSAYSNGNYDQAVSDFQQFFNNKNNRDKYYLTKDEKSNVYVAYAKDNGKYQQLLDDMTPFDSKTPVVLVNYLLKENQRPEIQKLNSDNKYIKFAKAYIDNNNEKMIDYANSDLVTNPQMAVACGKAFGTAKKISQAKNWLQTLNNQDVQQQATMAVIDGANDAGMNPNDVKKQLNVSD